MSCGMCGSEWRPKRGPGFALLSLFKHVCPMPKVGSFWPTSEYASTRCYASTAILLFCPPLSVAQFFAHCALRSPKKASKMEFMDCVAGQPNKEWCASGPGTQSQSWT